MKIFVDFDDVVFNAKKFKKDLIDVFKKNGVNKQDFENSYYTYSKKAQEEGSYYNPKDQIKVLKIKRQIDHKKLGKDIDELMKDLRGYVFRDVPFFISRFSKKDLFLITYGHEKFQMSKIRGAKLDKYFNKILISRDNKISTLVEMSKKHKFPKGERIILIDDRPEQLEKAEKFKKSIATFRMCRPEGRYSDLLCKDMDYEVKNLREAVKIIRREKYK